MGSSKGHPRVGNNGGENANIVDSFGGVKLESDKESEMIFTIIYTNYPIYLSIYLINIWREKIL